MSKHGMLLLVLGSLLMYTVLGAANLFMGELNQDEGWYLYAAHQTTEGRLPYRDYAFTQAPVLPFAYAVAAPLVSRFGVAGGRFFTWLLGAVAIALTFLLSARMVPHGWKWPAATLGLTLVAVNVYQSYFTTVVKTYSLSAVFITGALYAVTFWKKRTGALACIVAGALCALAAGTRISAGISLPIIGVYLLAQRKLMGDRSWLAFGAGGAIMLAMVFLPWLWLAPEGFRFGVFEYHAARSSGGLLSAMVYKLGFISRLVQAYFVSFCFAVSLAIFHWMAPGKKADNTSAATMRDPIKWLPWLVVIGISAIHFAAPFPYDDYQAMIYPMFCAALASGWIRHLAARETPLRVPQGTVVLEHGMPCVPVARILLLAAFITSAAASFSSPVNQAWFIAGRDRIWWRLKSVTAMDELDMAARKIKAVAHPGDELLTQDTYLAVQTDCKVPRGMEMGPFCYFPDFSTERAKTLHVLNRELLEELLQTTTAPVAAISGYAFAIKSPEVAELSLDDQQNYRGLLAARYELVDVIQKFGQGSTTLNILKLKQNASPSSP